ncbi:hypothetical protein CPC735_026650 [Coccidioides posadasii C735 delta SOWgp]|uniref:Uncharacterized protein n=1 Tax=Coccidioides posadasii (strain C735) TaxID=222929 RepID=C5P7C9_COCP7|nr:hypothetical protein CPC735_026650 [Coccidioides posadasii C735 delta SOWgp]EER27329.1 hypothetical protein CPC735_026650 [Coccidioides posadasii C735 delta SOWgp]|eukprot:XP_003069474.1 hypothetical protein CPC735_026650 [Coccidioides posadasii C735 delta SOWgp]
MESSPLTLAHTHARNALLETRKANPVAASEEHDLAAGEFAIAAQNTADKDALRTLLLLEQHHKRLAKIIRFQHENPPNVSSPEPESGLSPSTVAPTATPNSPSKPAPFTTHPSSQPLQQPPRLQATNRPGHRETTSLASNLASARGIPAYPRRGSPVPPTLSTQNGGAKMAEFPHKIRSTASNHTDTHSTRASGWKPSWSPAISPTEITQQQVVLPDSGDEISAPFRSLAGDEPFRRFYSTFGGLISKLSAPLAFASLPLGPDAAGQRSPTATKSPADTKVDKFSAAADLTQYSHREPDVKNLVSSAALRAIKDKDGYFGSNTSESFYVVPTSGGMISYAGILSRAEKEARRNSVEEDEDTFVDARENPPSPEARGSMNRDKTKGTRRNGRSTPKASSSGTTATRDTKTLEELQMENQALRHLSDTLAKRLHMWEVNAQSSSFALQQSLKAIQNQAVASRQASPSASASRPPPARQEAVDIDKIKDLENLVKNHEKELERVGKENEKLKTVLGRYRDRWEKLKEGARNRREGNGSSPAAASGANTTGAGSRPTGGADPEAVRSPVIPSADTDVNSGKGEDIQLLEE